MLSNQTTLETRFHDLSNRVITLQVNWNSTLIHESMTERFLDSLGESSQSDGLDCTRTEQPSVATTRSTCSSSSPSPSSASDSPIVTRNIRHVSSTAKHRVIFFTLFLEPGAGQRVPVFFKLSWRMDVPTSHWSVVHRLLSRLSNSKNQNSPRCCACISFVHKLYFFPSTTQEEKMQHW